MTARQAEALQELCELGKELREEARLGASAGVLDDLLAEMRAAHLEAEQHLAAELGQRAAGEPAP